MTKAKGSTKRGKGVTPKQKEQIIEGKALGIPERDIAPLVGVSPATVNRISHKPDIRERINQLATELVNEGHQLVKENILSTIKESNDQTVKPGTKEETAYRLGLRKLSLQASKNITDIAGLTTQQPSTVITQLINVEGNAVLSDNLKALLNNHTKAMTKDVTPKD